MSKGTQAERVLAYINTFGSITQYEAFMDLGIMRLASRIADLKKEGYIFDSEIVAVKNRFGENCYVKKYSLAVADDGSI